MKVFTPINHNHRPSPISEQTSNIYIGRLTKISISILEGILKKNSYERRDYESVDEKSLS